MKYILVGLILVLAGVLWLLLPAREGLDNPPAFESGNMKIGDVGMGPYSSEIGGTTPRFIININRMGLIPSVQALKTGLDTGKSYTVTVTGSPSGKTYEFPLTSIELGGTPPWNATFSNSTLSKPSPVFAGDNALKFKVTASSLAAPAPSCPTNGEGITSVKQSGGQNIRLYTRSECSALKGNYAPNGQTSWGMATNEVGECYGVPGGQNVSFCNQTAPPSSAASSAAGIIPPPPPPAPAPVAPPPPPAPPVPVAPPPPPPPAAAPAPSVLTDMTLGSFIDLLTRDLQARNPTALGTPNPTNVPVGSLLTQSTVPTNWQPAVNGTIPGPSASSMTMGRGALDEVPKSSLVPCTCPTYSMNCPIHVGSQPSSQVPGDVASALSKAQDQYDLMRPFTNTDRDVPGFLNSFSNFGV
jgi:hypothetical protein